MWKKPRKSGRNIADYDESMVEQIGLIKDLQENFFLPLSEIKKIIKQRIHSPLENFHRVVPLVLFSKSPSHKRLLIVSTHR